MRRSGSTRWALAVWVAVAVLASSATACTRRRVVTSRSAVEASERAPARGPLVSSSRLSVRAADLDASSARTATGRAGGPLDVSTAVPGCVGFVTRDPTFVLTVADALPALRLLVASPADTTLVVRRPNGQYWCSDDTEELNPAVSGSFGVGEYRVWVGTFRERDAGAPFVIGVGRLGSLTTGALLPELSRLGVELQTHVSQCGMTWPTYGPVAVGSGVTLGRHTPWTGSDGDGGYVQDDDNWATEMDAWVGQRTEVVSLEGLDQAGCAVVHVQIDGGRYYWRVRDLQSVTAPAPSSAAPPALAIPPESAWLRVEPSSVPRGCGLTSAYYGPVAVGTMVMLGRHSPYTGPDGSSGYASMDDAWEAAMTTYVGARTVIVVSLEGLDGSGCPTVRVAADGGRFPSRIRDMTF